MIHEWQERTALLIGGEALERLSSAHVLVVGLGGVGAYSAEQLCRAGIGRLTVVDGDGIEDSNRNRQLPALVSTVGKRKSAVVGERLKDINPALDLNVIDEFIRDDRMRQILSARYDYVVDAIDTLSPKVFLVKISLDNGLRVVSSMGSGGKLDPEKIKVSDISKSYNCRLARAMRKRLHRMGITSGFKVVFSPEDVDDSSVVSPDEEKENQKSVVGTVSYMPAVFGCICASVVIRDIISA